MKTTIKILKKMIHEEIIHLCEDAEQSDIEMKLNGAKNLTNQNRWQEAMTELTNLKDNIPENIRPMFKQTVNYTKLQSHEEGPDIVVFGQMIDKIIGMLRTAS